MGVTALDPQRPLHRFNGRVISRQKTSNLAPLVPVDDGGERGGQVGHRSDEGEICRPSRAETDTIRPNHSVGQGPEGRQPEKVDDGVGPYRSRRAPPCSAWLQYLAKPSSISIGSADLPKA